MMMIMDYNDTNMMTIMNDDDYNDTNMMTIVNDDMIYMI